MGERAGQVGRSEPGEPRYRANQHAVGETELTPRSAEQAEAAETDETERTTVAREEIEQTRTEMSGTIDAIQERLNPEVLTEQAKDTAHEVTEHAIQQAKEAARDVAEHAIQQAKVAVLEVTGQAKAALREATIGKAEDMVRNAGETATGWRQTLVETIKEHPVPAALAGLSLGWLYLNRASGSSRPPARYQGYQGSAGYRPGGYGYAPGEYRAQGSPSPQGERGVAAVADRAQDSIGRVADQAQQKAGEVVDQVQDTAGNVVDQVQETAGQVVDQVQEQASRAQGYFQQQLHENPLVVGAVAVALGGALGAMMRPTRSEDQLLGQARDRLMGRAQEVTQDTMQRVGRVAVEAQRAAKDEAQEQDLLSQPGGQAGAKSPSNPSTRAGTSGDVSGASGASGGTSRIDGGGGPQSPASSGRAPSPPRTS